MKMRFIMGMQMHLLTIMLLDVTIAQYSRLLNLLYIVILQCNMLSFLLLSSAPFWDYFLFCANHRQAGVLANPQEHKAIYCFGPLCMGAVFGLDKQYSYLSS